MQRPFAQVDVFTTRLGLGNPLAVVLDGSGLSTAEMRRFARWTNVSETTFVLPPDDVGADYRVRILTPDEELPLIATGRLAAPYVATQGSALGRAGRIEITQDPDGTIWTGGRSVTVIRGTADLAGLPPPRRIVAR
jgi:predicted PhzF superfamily epimerase YddE/YHI9